MNLAPKDKAMHYKETSAFSAIKLAEGNKVPNKVQVLRVGKFKHPSYGDFEITPKVLAEMKTNFDARVRGIDISFDYYHDSDKDAAGWPTALELSSDGTELWAINVDWTPEATKKLSDRALRYFSPDFAFKYVDPETGKSYSNVLLGGGLTNRPFVKEMKAIVAAENKTGANDMNELEKAQAALKLSEEKVVKLTEEKAAAETKLADMAPKSKIEELTAKIAELQKELEAEKAKGETVLAEKTKVEEEKKLAEKTAKFNLMLSEGKACAAQKDAFLKGDMDKFLELAEKPNLNGSGSGSSGGDGGGADAEKVLKLAEDKRKADKNLSQPEAIKLARKELAAKK